MSAYISVTDVRTAEQAERFRQAFLSARGAATGYKLGIGVMMSYNVLNGRPSRFTNAFPRPDELSSIFRPNSSQLNTLHYADYEGRDVKATLERVTRLCGPHLQALQLDMTWPDPNILARYRERHPNIELILQIGQPALDLVHGEPAQVLARVRAYRGIIANILLDGSIGTGKLLSEEACRPVFRALWDNLPEVELGIAGGLGPETLYLLNSLLEDFPGLSFDAQSRLRPSLSALDPLDEEFVIRYIRGGVNKLIELTAHH